MTTELAVSVPESLFGALRKAPHEVGREIRIAAAIHCYQQGMLSMELAAETAGMDRPQFLVELAHGASTYWWWIRRSET